MRLTDKQESCRALTRTAERTSESRVPAVDGAVCYLSGKDLRRVAKVNLKYAEIVLLAVIS